MNTTIVMRVEHEETWVGPYTHEGPFVDAVMRTVKEEGADTLRTHQPTAMFDIPGYREWLADFTARFAEKVFGHDYERERQDCLATNKFFMDAIVYGFTELHQLVRWFGDSLASLAEAGYVVGVYQVRSDKLIKSDNQCAFIDVFGERMGHMSLGEFYGPLPDVRQFGSKLEPAPAS